MLEKLLKYDLKWIYKGVVIFYILALIFSIIGRGLSLIKNSLVFELISQIASGIAISMLVNSLINSLMRLWARFVRNGYKDESYLTHTLPIKRKTIYASKVISALICILTTVIIAIICLFICYYSEANMEVLKSSLEIAASTYNTTVLNLLAVISILLFIEIILIVLIGYMGIILGFKSNKNKILKTFIVGFVLYMSTQVLTLVVIGAYGLLNPSVMNLINTTQVIDIEAIKSVMYVGIGIYIIYTIFYYVFGKKQFEKGVNVE